MANAHKAAGQDMLSKPSGKLLIAQSHLPGLATTSVVFIAEAYLCLLYTLDAVIADGYFVRISAQVFDDLFWSAKRTFGIHHPLCLKEAFYKLLILYGCTSQCSHILCPEYFAQSLYRKQILIAAQLLLPFAILIYSSSRNNAVQVRMQAQVLSPCMQYRYHS